MSTTTAVPEVAILLTELERACALTRRVLERLPEASFDWRPHPKSYTAGQLATHLADILNWVAPTFEYPEYDLSADATGESSEPATTSAELLSRFDTAAAAAHAALAAATPADLAFVWTMRNGEQLLLRQPRAAVVREWFLDHTVHHRAQLGVYLRLLDQPVPALYGPSADEPDWVGPIAE